jgi:hypothetical protein
MTKTKKNQIIALINANKSDELIAVKTSSSKETVIKIRKEILSKD